MKILVIRRDNIGDLVCTTPLLTCLSEGLPGAEIDVLANEYNCQVLEGNPHIGKVWVYKKAKHRKSGESFLKPWLDTVRLMLEIRKVKYDYAILASPGFQSSAERIAKYGGVGKILGYTHPGSTVDVGLPAGLAKEGHEVEATTRLASLLGLEVPPDLPLFVLPSQQLKEQFIASLGPLNGSTVALHISARKKSQRWPVENFAALAHQLHARHGASFLLFWSPGAEDDPRHPGDDAKAEVLLSACLDLPIKPVKTDNLRELIAALSLADSYIGSDGGAMHVAAGLGLPVVAMFGASSAERWRPWSKKALVLQPASREVSDLSPSDVLGAWEALQDKTELLLKK